MTFQDKISILVTFIAGFLIGGYLFLAGFLPTFGISGVRSFAVVLCYPPKLAYLFS